MSEEKEEQSTGKRKQRDKEKSGTFPHKKTKMVSSSEFAPIFSVPFEIVRNFCPGDESLLSLSQTCKRFNKAFPSRWKKKFIDWLSEGGLTYEQWEAQHRQRLNEQGGTFNPENVNWHWIYDDALMQTQNHAKLLYSYFIKTQQNDGTLPRLYLTFPPDELHRHLLPLTKSIRQLNQSNYGNELAIVKYFLDLWEKDDRSLWLNMNTTTQNKISGEFKHVNITLMGMYIYLLDVPIVRFLLEKGFSVNEEYTLMWPPEEHILMTCLYRGTPTLNQPFFTKVLDMLQLLLKYGLDTKRFCFVPGGDGGILTYLAIHAHTFVDLIPQVKKVIDALPDSYFIGKVISDESDYFPETNEEVHSLHSLVEQYDTTDKTLQTSKATFCEEIFKHLFNTRPWIIDFFSGVSHGVCETVDQFIKNIRNHKDLTQPEDQIPDLRLCRCSASQ